MKRNRFGLTAAAVIAMAALTACSSLGGVTAAGPSGTSSDAPPPSTSTAPPTAPATKPPKPSPTVAPTPKPVQTVIKPASNIDPSKRSTQTGYGASGALKSTGSKSVALTFDDGPDPTYTPAILDLLKKNDAKATFCLVGKQAKKYPDLVRKIAAAGHTLCNHSWSHRLDLAKQTEEEIRQDLRWTNNAIHAAVPGAKIKYFRAPGGNFTKELVELVGDMGMKSIYWSLDTRDWDFARYGRGISMINHIITVVTNGVRPGSIVLAHDFRKPDTIAAFRILLPWLKPRVKLIGLPV